MASTLLFNGTILTMQPEAAQCAAMFIENNVVIATGTWNEVVQYQTAQTHLIDLQGKCVMPGFNDAHIHVWKVGQLESFIIDLRGISSLPALQTKVKAIAKTLPAGTWILGRGFNEAVLAEKRIPLKEDLDAISTEHPIYLIRTCAHIVVVNSLALQKANINTQTQPPAGGLIGKTSEGEINGIFYETALGLITNHIPPPTKEEYKRMILLGIQKLLRAGITSATDPAVHPELLQAYFELHEKNELPIRMNLMPILLPDGGNKPYEIPVKYNTDFLSVNTVKFFSDGGLSGKTASLKRYYKNSTDVGVLRLDQSTFLTLASQAQEKGLRIATHAIGDKALDLVIDVYKSLHKIFGNTRNRIEHFGLPSDANIDDVEQHGFIPVPQPIFLDELGENFIQALDEEYLKRCYPVQSLLNKKITVAFSTDAPVVKNINPWSGIKAAMSRKTNVGNFIAPHEAVTINQALWAYTMGSAYAEGTELSKGSLEPGKLADFIILDRNPMTLAAHELESITVIATYVNGVKIFDHKS